MVLTLHPSLSAGNTEGSPYYQPRSESCPRYSSTLRLRLNFAIDRRHLIGNIYPQPANGYGNIHGITCCIPWREWLRSRGKLFRRNGRTFSAKIPQC